MKKSSSRSFFGHDGIGGAICAAIKVKRYLRSKKGNVHTSCLFLAKEFRQ